MFKKSANLYGFSPNIPKMVFVFLKEWASMSALPRNIYLKAYFEK